jgi:hypothetical protein
MPKVLSFLFILFIFQSIQAQSFDDGLRKLEIAKETEQRLYPTYTQEIFSKTVTSYHEAGHIFYNLLNTQEHNKLKNSYFTLHSWLLESELLEALNKSREICDIYVNTFDLFVPANKFDTYNQKDINKTQYDTTFTKTLWLLYYNTIECHKDIYTIKYGNLLKNYITKGDQNKVDLYINIIQSNVNIELFSDAFQTCKEYTVACKGLKINEEQKNALHKALNDLKQKSGESLTEEQKKELDKI